MDQFGSATVIKRSTALVLMDCFETLVECDQDGYRPRRGVPTLLAFLRRKGIPVAVISDAPKATVLAALAGAGLQDRVGRIWHSGNAQEVLPDGRCRKRLDLPVAEHGCRADQAVFIGDSPFDALDARHYGIPFIRVPRSEDRTFSFARLVDGPSRYSSGEFTDRFLRRYLGSPPRPTEEA